MTETVLIAGVSVRSLSESAVRAGYRVVAVDAFADLDLRTLAAEVHRVDPYTAEAAARVAAHIPAVAACYVSNFENHPEALRPLARGRALWGNTARTLARARDPAVIVRELTAAGLPAARVRSRAPGSTSRAAQSRWLLKPRASGGGHGVRPWSSGVTVHRTCVLQERMPGRPGSVVFAADGVRAVVLGVTRQLVGEPRLGARDFRYCGTLLAPPDDPGWGARSPIAARGAELVATLTPALGLVGVNGVDVMVHRGRVVPIEVNPRPTAATELIERRDGVSIFRAHVAGCTRQLTGFAISRPSAAAVGKAIVFARQAVTIRAASRWLRDPDIRDIPADGSIIPAGGPICTVFADAPTTALCYSRLLARAERVYADVERRVSRDSGFGVRERPEGQD